MLPEGLLSGPFLQPENCYSGKRGDHMVLFQEFPWELPGVQAYQIFGIQSTVMDDKMVKVIQNRLGLKLSGPLQGQVQSEPDILSRVWEVTLDFQKIHEENGQQVMGTIPMREREWIHTGQKWNIRNGGHCTGCHGQGHQINDCFLAPYVAPYNQRLFSHQP